MRIHQVIEEQPQLYEIAYSLGLLLGEMKRYLDAEIYLRKAASGMPDYGRVHYNHGQVLLLLNRPGQGEKALRLALDTEPQNQEYFIALVDFYLSSNQSEKAKALALSTLRRFPDHDAARMLLQNLGK